MPWHIKLIWDELASVWSRLPSRTRTRFRRKIHVRSHLNSNVRHELSGCGLTPVWDVGRAWCEKNICDGENLPSHLLTLLIAVVQLSLFGKPALPGRNETTSIVNQRQKVTRSIVT